MDYAHWADEFAKKDAKVGSTLRIRVPADFTVSDGPGLDLCHCGRDGHPLNSINCRVHGKQTAVLTRYNSMTDEVVPVTQEWVNEVQGQLRAFAAAQKEARGRLMFLEAENHRLMALAAQASLEAIAASAPFFVAQSQWMPLECPIVKADPEPLPQSEADRIWEAVKAAALT